MNRKISTLLCRIPSTLTAVSSRSFIQDPSSKTSSSPLISPRRLLLAGGFCAAGGLYAYYSGFSNNQQSFASTPDSDPISHLLPEAPPANDKCRKIRYPENKTALKITLYQYTTCPFCCKVRAFLDYYGLNYDIVEVNSVFKKEIKWSPNYKKVPILVVQTPQGDHLQLNDSTMIISALMTYLKDQSKDLKSVLEGYPQVVSVDAASGKSQVEIRNKYFIMSGSNPKESSEEYKMKLKDELHWRKWVDGVFVHRISPNVYRSFSESLEAFHWFDLAGDWRNVFNAFERQVVIYTGATVMWILGKVLKRRYDIQDDVREAIYFEVNKFLASVKKSGGPFCGGEEPNLADISFYGSLNSFEGCVAFQDILSNTQLKTWFKKMKWAVGSRAGSSRI